ncbi:ras-related protein RHN1 [Anoplophora glabripennis]|uniref:ras-related protein RHN1 n=1 Tax=Anoplophora glabripennis TaxID=217634 RepID=UPI0008741032|nr:ras-related protein RHN1 [Anoplophora glabripennis]
MKTIIGKVVVLGYQGVGKTCTVIRYVENTFSKQIAPTVGASFFSCKLNIEGTQVTLQIWDTAGQERFKAMAPMFYRNANAALLIFDITSSSSFESMKGWVQELKRNVDEPMVLCVVGNKIDLADKRQVTRDEAVQYSKTIGASYMECSAMADQGIGLIFEKIALGLLRLSGQKTNHTLKVYDDDIMATSSELEATDTANEETVNISIHSIAHGRTVKSKCC